MSMSPIPASARVDSDAVSDEAVEAFADAYIKTQPVGTHVLFVNVRAALTAALPYLVSDLDAEIGRLRTELETWQRIVIERDRPRPATDTALNAKDLT